MKRPAVASRIHHGKSIIFLRRFVEIGDDEINFRSVKTSNLKIEVESGKFQEFDL